MLSMRSLRRRGTASREVVANITKSDLWREVNDLEVEMWMTVNIDVANERKKLAAALEQLAEANIASKVDDVDLFCRPITKEWHRWHPSCGGEPVIQPILMSEATRNEESEEEEPARHDAVNRQAGSHHARMESGRVDGQHIELK